MNLKALTAAAAVAVCCMGNAANAAPANTAKEYGAQFRGAIAHLNGNSSDKVLCDATAELRIIQNENKWVGEQTGHMGWNQAWHDRNAEVNGNYERCVRLGFIAPPKTIAQQQQELKEVLGLLQQLNGGSSSSSSSNTQVTTADWHAFCGASRSPNRIYRNTGSHGCWNGQGGGSIYSENDVRQWIRNGRGAR